VIISCAALDGQQRAISLRKVSDQWQTAPIKPTHRLGKAAYFEQEKTVAEVLSAMDAIPKRSGDAFFAVAPCVERLT
jgi:hypothetical protein